jgi:hypothetical protein
MVEQTVGSRALEKAVHLEPLSVGHKVAGMAGVRAQQSVERMVSTTAVKRADESAERTADSKVAQRADLTVGPSERGRAVRRVG